MQLLIRQSRAFAVPGDVTLKMLLAPVIDQFKYVKQFPILNSQEAVPKTLIHGTSPGSSGSKLSYQLFCFEMNFHRKSTRAIALKVLHRLIGRKVPLEIPKNHLVSDWQENK